MELYALVAYLSFLNNRDSSTRFSSLNKWLSYLQVVTHELALIC